MPTPDVTPQETISLDKTKIDKGIGEISTAITETITATTNASGTIMWSSSNTEVAEVIGHDKTAIITIKPVVGTAVITAKIGDIETTCNINIIMFVPGPKPY